MTPGHYLSVVTSYGRGPVMAKPVMVEVRYPFRESHSESSEPAYLLSTYCIVLLFHLSPFTFPSALFSSVLSTQHAAPALLFLFHPSLLHSFTLHSFTPSLLHSFT